MTVPTTVLGGLIGSGVGAVHGPWIKVGQIQKRFEDATPKEVVDAIEQEAAQGKMVEEHEQIGEPHQVQAPKPRKKPRKIEIRSQQQVEASMQSEST